MEDPREWNYAGNTFKEYVVYRDMSALVMDLAQKKLCYEVQTDRSKLWYHYNPD